MISFCFAEHCTLSSISGLDFLENEKQIGEKKKQQGIEDHMQKIGDWRKQFFDLKYSPWRVFHKHLQLYLLKIKNMQYMLLFCHSGYDVILFNVTTKHTP